MSDIHYFQRYSQRENVVTNNTLRLFAQIYRDSPGRLERLLEKIVDGVEIDIGVQMQQQTSAPSSVPDGSLQQSSFKVVIETKRTKTFGVGQLLRHLEAFDEEEQRILLLLVPEVDNTAVSEAASAIEAEDEDIIFAAFTFADLIDVLIGDGDLVSTYEQDLYELVEDYQNYCSEERLLPKDDVLRAVPCRKSHEENTAFNLYYAPASRGYRSHQFLGIYYHKSIRHIGRLDKEVVVDRVNGELKLKDGDTKTLTADEKQRVHDAMDAGTERGWDIETGHKFFLVDQFYDTDFTKASKYGMRKNQYFSLRDALGVDKSNTLPDTESIADRLKSESWT